MSTLKRLGSHSKREGTREYMILNKHFTKKTNDSPDFFFLRNCDVFLNALYTTCTVPTKVHTKYLD